MKGWNASRRRKADAQREAELASVLAELRRRDSTAKELVRACGLSMFQVRRALRAHRRAMLVTWLPQRKNKAHSYTRRYLATSGRAQRRRARA
jgi:transcription initiation factor IIE alpha subunit